MKIYRITAMWCMSCLTMKKTWKAIFKDMPNLDIIDIDYDESINVVKELNVGNILPELIIFKDDKEIKRIIGEKSKKQMLKIFEELNEQN